MVRFVIDEDMPRSTGVALSTEGYEVKDVRDHGYRGLGDEEIYTFAQREKAVLLTGDLGFSNILKFPLGQHFGIVVARFPNEMAPREINREIVTSLRDLGENEFKGNLVILEPGRIRIKRAPL
jgi:predicted nuclease of predicted toxin-antitoxin system